MRQWLDALAHELRRLSDLVRPPLPAHCDGLRPPRRPRRCTRQPALAAPDRSDLHAQQPPRKLPRSVPPRRPTCARLAAAASPGADVAALLPGLPVPTYRDHAAVAIANARTAPLRCRCARMGLELAALSCGMGTPRCRCRMRMRLYLACTTQRTPLACTQTTPRAGARPTRTNAALSLRRRRAGRCARSHLASFPLGSVPT
jgi:hypothetical protein